MNRQTVVRTLCAMLFALSFSAEAQQREKVYRIGYLSSGKPSSSTDPGLNAFRQRLRELGYVEGQNVVIEYRYAQLDPTRLSVLSTELANLKVDVILTSPDEPPIRAVQLATRTIPVVMPGIVVDPLEPTFWGEKQRAPLVASLAKPGGNFTGLTNFDSDLQAKRLELLKEGFPRISRVALLWPRAQQQKQTLKDIEALRQALGIEIQSLAAGSLEDFERALAAMSRESPDALLVARSQVILNIENALLDSRPLNGCRQYLQRVSLSKAVGSCPTAPMHRTYTVEPLPMWTKSSKAPNLVSFPSSGR